MREKKGTPLARFVFFNLTYISKIKKLNIKYTIFVLLIFDLIKHKKCLYILINVFLMLISKFLDI